MKPKLVETTEDVIKNVKEYQHATHSSSRIKPRLVRGWYYIPSLDMVGASRFIGYNGMTAELYDKSDVDGGLTEKHFQNMGWFRQLQPNEKYYNIALKRALELSTQHISPHARFYVLK